MQEYQVPRNSSRYILKLIKINLKQVNIFNEFCGYVQSDPRRVTVFRRTSARPFHNAKKEHGRFPAFGILRQWLHSPPVLSLVSFGHGCLINLTLDSEAVIRLRLVFSSRAFSGFQAF
jgi:hypothetical protein